jgi:single-strand DNA-binding protein
MNKVVLIGRLTADPDLRVTPNGTSVASFRLAVDRRVKQEGQPDADFIPVVVWGKLAENVVAKYCGKGRQIAVSGRLQTRTWIGKNEEKRYTTEVIAEELQLLAQPQTSNSPSKPAGVPAEPVESDLDGFADLGTFDESDLPF